ncbi:MAG: FtsX-like permease family protein [Thermoplasmata archaeon]|nr:FtsX-like permease family protein [Thermoplasmata archaeon]
MAVGSLPEQTFYGENVYVISQVTNDKSIPYELAEDLRNQSWVDAVSPETYAFCLVKGEPVVVRGIESDGFLAIDQGTVISGSVGDEFLLAGARLSSRIDLNIGDRVLLTGSTEPTLEEMEVTATYESGGPSNDEILIPLNRSWGITPVGRGHVIAMRVRADSYATLKTFLNDTEIPLVLGDGTTSVVLNSEERFDARLATLLFQHPELGGERGVAHTSLFVQQAGNSVQVVIWGFLVLNSSLIVLGIVAVLAKAVVEKRSDLGILSAIGATRLQIARMLVIDLLLLAIPAVLAGILLGYVLASLLGAGDVIVLFGYAILPPFNLLLLLELAIVGLLLTVVLGTVIYHLMSREKPLEMISGTVTEEARETLEEVLSD